MSAEVDEYFRVWNAEIELRRTASESGLSMTKESDGYWTCSDPVAVLCRGLTLDEAVKWLDDELYHPERHGWKQKGAK